VDSWGKLGYMLQTPARRERLRQCLVPVVRERGLDPERIECVASSVAGRLGLRAGYYALSVMFAALAELQ
jgi:hypothetical protein